MRIALFLAALAFTTPLHAQSVSFGAIEFDPLTVGPLPLTENYIIDQAFGEANGVVIDSPVLLSLPDHENLHIRTRAMPEGGSYVSFVFFQEAATPQDRVYLEDLQVTDATIPLFPDAADPIHERRVVAARLLEQDVFPQWAARYEGAEIFAIEAIELGNVPGALQLVAGYYDHEYDDQMMMRAVILPHPDREASYMAVATINLDEVAVTNAETMAETMSGRVLRAWQYQ